MGLLNDKDLGKYLALIGTFFACELRDKQDGSFANETYKRFCAVREHIYTMMKNNEWVSVKDRMPENQSPVVVFVPPHVDNDKGTFLGYVGMAYFTRLGEGFWCGTDGNLYGAIGMIYPPTHWMPLPEPPKEVSE